MPGPAVFPENLTLKFAVLRLPCYSYPSMKKSPIDELQRLLLLAGTDEGFFILAVHSYVEGLANTIQPGFTQWSSFDQLIGSVGIRGDALLKEGSRSFHDDHEANRHTQQSHDTVINKVIKIQIEA